MDESQLNAAERGLMSRAANRAARRYAWYRVNDSLADELPRPLLEADLLATYYAGAARRRRHGGRTYLTSGTSTGMAKRVWWPSADHRRYVATRAKLLAGFAGGACVTACADLGTGHAADSALEVFAAAGLRGGQIDVNLPIEAHVERLRQARPDLLFTMPMILERIIAAGGPGYAPRRVVVLGDIAPLEWRRAIAARLEMEPRDILDVFGSIEVGAIAYWSEAAGAYLFHENVIPELIDGLLGLTSVDRAGFPAVRYVAGDVVSGLRRLRVGNIDRWGYEAHLGRVGNELKHGEMLSVHAIAVALAQTAPGVPWNVRRAGLQAVITIDARAWTPELAEKVRSAVRAAHPAVDVMIRNGLVGDIDVVPEVLTVTQSKRRLVPVPSL